MVVAAEAPVTKAPPAATAPPSLARNPSTPAAFVEAPARDSGSKDKKQGGGFISSVRGFFKSMTAGGSQEMREEDFVVSAPESFEHRSHVGWDKANGFDVKNLPPEWKSLFKSAGLKKKGAIFSKLSYFDMIPYDLYS